MLRFFSNGTITESKLITGIKLQDNHDHQNPKNIIVTQFKGATVVDPNLGNYVVLDFTVTDAAALDIDHIILMNNETPVADSADKQLSIVKEANKNLKIRLAAQFAGAEHCKFNTTSVNLPYATSFRDGVVRFANVTTNYGDTGWNITDNEENKSGTVYSADVVDKKINQVTSSLGNLDQYAKKAEPNEFTAANTFKAGITVNGEINGDAVATRGMGVNAKDTMVVSLGYADDRYLSKTDATAAAGNYAKLNADNDFAVNTTNTFNGDVTVKGTFVVGDSQEAATFMVADNRVSGTAIQTDIVGSSDSNLLPTEGAVKSALNAVESALTEKDNNLQSQIDGINAGQNLADIVDTAGELAGYDVSHLKAKGDFQHGAEGATWSIGDKVQVLGGGNVQSCVYELVKGTKPNGEGSKDIQSTNNNAYYWRYIGVYGTNAYTKAEVNTELAKKVDKTQIITTIADDTATATNVTSGSAVKTYVDGKVGDINSTLTTYVTLGTEQEITGAKTFANGNITIANQTDGNKDKHYVTVGAAGDNTTSDYTSSIMHYDLTHNDYANDTFTRARPNNDPKKSSDNVSYTRNLLRGGTNGYTFCSKLEQHIGTHYNYTASDMYMTTGDPNNISPLPAAQIGTPGNTASTDDSLTENYVERIRLRKNTSVAGDADIEFLSAGESVTDIDLFADNINNVFNNEVSFRVCTTSGEGVKTDTSVLKIHSTGIYYHTPDGNSISTTEYQLRTAGSLDFTTNMSQLVGSDAHVPTTKAVAAFVDDKIKGVTGGTEFVKTKAHDTNQTIDSAITVTQGITVGTNNTVANLDVTGIITGNAVATRALGSSDGTRLPTEGAVVSFVNDKLVENRSDISDKTKVGAMGLFLYTGGDFKEMGTEVAGASLQAVGMQLPMDGVVSWSQGAAMAGTWKLLNNTIAGEPCLVLAIRVGV